MAVDHWCECNGVSLRYRDVGSGPPVVLVHGWTLDLEMWTPQTAALSDRFRAIVYDRRGFGLSSGHPSTELDPKDLASLSRHLELERLALVGMSQGVRAVMRFALSAAERISCVVLDGPPDLIGADNSDYELPLQYGRGRPAAGLEAFRREWIEHPLMRLRTRDRSAHERLRSMIDRYPGKDLAAASIATEPGIGQLQLESFNVPTLIVTGEHDLADRIESADALARRLRATRATVADAGHLPNLDNPAAYNAILRDFLGRYHTTTPG